jgi:outer membrane protein assembly factor BamC
VRPVALGSRVLENEQQSTVYFDVVDGMGRSVTDFVWRAAEQVLERRGIGWQQQAKNLWLSQPVSRAEEMGDDSSFWDFSDSETSQLQSNFRYQLKQEPAEHQRTTSLTIDLVDATEQYNGQTVAMSDIRQTNIEVMLLNAIISEVNRTQQQAVLAQGNQVVPLSLATNNNQEPAFIIGLNFENAWPLAGLALEAIGLSVDDLNRDAGTYFVDYSAPDSGFLFMGGDDYDALDIEEGEYEIRLVEYNDDTAMTVIKDDEVVPAAWLQAIEDAFAAALQEQNQR